MEFSTKTSPGKKLRLREMQPHEIKDEGLRDFSAMIGTMPSHSIFIAVDEDADQDELVNTVLGGRYKLERLIRRDNHAIVYSVKSLGMIKGCLEARSYILSGISKEILRSRRRNMKRLASRVIYEAEYEGRTILVYRADQEGTTNGKAVDNLLQNLEEEVNSKFTIFLRELTLSFSEEYPLYSPTAVQLGPSKGTTNEPKKSQHQRQVAGIKQRARRARKREERRPPGETGALAEDQKHGESDKTGRKNPSPDDRIVKFLLRLHRQTEMGDLTVTETGSDISGKDEREERGILTRYLRNDSIAGMSFNSRYHAEKTLAIVKKEILFLNKQLRSLPRILDKQKLHCEKLSRQLAALDESSWEWEGRKEEVEMARNKLRTLSNAEALLLEILKVANQCHQQIAERTKLIVRTGEAFFEAYDKSLKLEDLETMERQKSFLVPFSSSYNELEVQTQAIRKNIESTDVRELKLIEEKAWEPYKQALHGSGQGPENVSVDLSDSGASDD